jgi:uncharacterized protein (TIRG00374 family)
MAAHRPPAGVLEGAVLVTGSILLVALVHAIGGAALIANLRLVGWGIVLVVGQEVLAIVANTLGWWTAFPAPRPALPFRRLVAARLAGDAINYVTPTASLGGELVRGRVLAGQAPRLDLATSIAVAKISQTVAQAAFVTLGMALTLATAPLASWLRIALGVVTTGMIVAAAGLVAAQRRGMFRALAGVVRVFDRRGRFAELEPRMRRLDAEIAAVHRAPGRFLRSCTWFFAGWALGALEVYLILWLLRMPASLALAVTIETLSQVIDAVLFFVPGKIGTQEGGKVLIFAALALDGAKGLSLGVLRRIRELAWAAVGLLILWRRQLGAAPAPAAAPAPSRLSVRR